MANNHISYTKTTTTILVIIIIEKQRQRKNTRSMWKHQYREKNHDIYVYL